MAVRRRLFVKCAGGDFRGKIAIEHFLDVLADMQRIEHLHVRKAVEKDDALDQLVGMLHLFDGFLAPLFGEGLVAPIVEQAVMQPILIDGRQFMPQPLVEVIEDTGLASHLNAPGSNRMRGRQIANYSGCVRPRKPARRLAPSSVDNDQEWTAGSGPMRAGLTRSESDRRGNRSAPPRPARRP